MTLPEFETNEPPVTSSQEPKIDDWFGSQSVLEIVDDATPPSPKSRKARATKRGQRVEMVRTAISKESSLNTQANPGDELWPDYDLDPEAKSDIRWFDASAATAAVSRSMKAVKKQATGQPKRFGTVAFGLFLVAVIAIAAVPLLHLKQQMEARRDVQLETQSVVRALIDHGNATSSLPSQLDSKTLRSLNVGLPAAYSIGWYESQTTEAPKPANSFALCIRHHNGSGGVDMHATYFTSTGTIAAKSGDCPATGTSDQ